MQPVSATPAAAGERAQQQHLTAPWGRKASLFGWMLLPSPSQCQDTWSSMLQERCSSGHGYSLRGSCLVTHRSPGYKRYWPRGVLVATEPPLALQPGISAPSVRSRNS